jgi:hypothetical protein
MKTIPGEAVSAIGRPASDREGEHWDKVEPEGVAREGT